MITNLIRKALGPEIETILNEEHTRLKDIISAMEDAVDDVKSIRASDIADNINTYDMIDTYELADRIAGEIGNNIEINYSDLAREISDNIDMNENEYKDRVNARINTLQIKWETVERKMDLILKYHGITPENV